MSQHPALETTADEYVPLTKAEHEAMLELLASKDQKIAQLQALNKQMATASSRRPLPDRPAS